MFITCQIIHEGRISPNLANLIGIPQPGDVVSLGPRVADTVLVKGVRIDAHDSSIYLIVERVPELTRNFSRLPPSPAKKSKIKKQPSIRVALWNWHDGELYGDIEQPPLLVRTGQQIAFRAQLYSVTRIYWISNETVVHLNVEKCAPPTPERNPSSTYVSGADTDALFGARPSIAWIAPESIAVAEQYQTPRHSLHSQEEHNQIPIQLSRPHTPPHQIHPHGATNMQASLELMFKKVFDRQLEGKDVATHYKNIFKQIPAQLGLLRSLACSMVELLNNLLEPNLPTIAIPIHFWNWTLTHKVAFFLNEGLYYRANTVSLGYIPVFKKMTDAEVQECNMLLSTLITLINLKLGAHSKESLPLPRSTRYNNTIAPIPGSEENKENSYQAVEGMEAELPGMVPDAHVFQPIVLS